MPPASPTRLRRAPERLLVWQRTLHSLVTRPLDSRGRTSRAPLDGVAAPRLARSLVKPSATLEPLERIEIYNRMYWARVLDSLAEDFPGLRALLGEERFTELSCRYLAAHPSRRPSLRDLGAQLPGFVRRHPRLIGSHAGAATDLARCEWAQIIAFDAAQLPPLNATDLTSARPSRLRVRLQPGITLLQLNHAVDEFWHAIKRGGSFRSDASNTRLIRPTSFAPTADGVRPPLRGRVHLAVHRFEGRIYTKRLDSAAFRVLRALARGESLTLAAARCPKAKVARLEGWFAEWMSLGWLSRRAARRE